MEKILHNVEQSSKKFRPGTMLANFHMCGIMLVLRVVLGVLTSIKLCLRMSDEPVIQARTLNN